jgi:soluble lytic murein transglycosylase-like protein
MGMMQIMPATWNEWAPKVGVSDPFDPYSNLRVGAAYLSYLRGYLHDLGYPQTEWALAAYNWGPHKVRWHLKNGGYWSGIPASTQNYARGIVTISQTGGVRWVVDEKLQRRLTVNVDQAALSHIQPETAP